MSNFRVHSNALSEQCSTWKDQFGVRTFPQLLHSRVLCVGSPATEVFPKGGGDYHSLPRMRELNKSSPPSVQYADLCDVVKMLNMEGSGSFMENVNDAQKLVDLPNAS